jgi:multiple sugar transport system substrate-binding protein
MPTTAAIQSGTGPGYHHAARYLAATLRRQLADVSDVAEEIGQAQGGYYDTQPILLSRTSPVARM